MEEYISEGNELKQGNAESEEEKVNGSWTQSEILTTGLNSKPRDEKNRLKKISCKNVANG